jgi:hypothetical protein
VLYSVRAIGGLMRIPAVVCWVVHTPLTLLAILPQPSGVCATHVAGQPPPSFSSSSWFSRSLARSLTVLIISNSFTQCGIMHYCMNSRVIHLTSPNATGPFGHREVVLSPRDGHWDNGAVHGISVHRLPNGLWVRV